jgi:hypothetical protein
MDMTIRAKDLNAGKSLGVSFRTGAFRNRKKEPRRASGKNWTYLVKEH